MFNTELKILGFTPIGIVKTDVVGAQSWWMGSQAMSGAVGQLWLS